MTGKDPGEVMMPMSEEKALTHIEITILRQVSENLSAQTRHLESLGKKVDDVRERVIRLEAQEAGKQVEALGKRVSMLETQGSKISGATAFGAWIAQSAPWLLAGVMAALALLKKG